MSMNPNDPLDPGRRRPLDYAGRGTGRTPMQKLARAGLIVLVTLAVFFGLLLGTCAIMMRH